MPLNRRAFINRLGLGTAALSVTSAIPIRLFGRGPPVNEHLPRCPPEQMGIASHGVREFLAAWDRSREALHSEPHSFMMVRHGHVVAEGWWTPYRRDSIHVLHSLSKSFTSTAVGFAVAEGKLRVDDKVTAFFPDELPSDIGANLGRLRVRDLLTMSVGRAEGTYSDISHQDDWVRAFLSLPIQNPPGSIFSYDNWATYMLSAIVQKLSGERAAAYLKSRFFDSLAFDATRWETCPRGINTGGWGLSATTESLAKFGQFYLQKGEWQRRRLLPREWVEEATTFKIQQPSTWGPAAESGARSDPAADLDRLKKTHDWYQGYCYQFWRCRHDAYRGDGAFGQFCVVMPDQDAVIAITSETADMQGLLNLVWEHLLPAMHDGELPVDEASAAQLRHEMAAMTLPLPGSPTGPGIAAAVARGKFRLENNSLEAQSVLFDVRDGSCTFTLTHANGSSRVRCGTHQWIDGLTDMPGTPTLAPWDDFGKRSSHLPVRVAAACAWKHDHTLEMHWRFCERGNRDTVTCRFDGARVEIEFQNSITQIMASRPETRPVLKGRREV